MVKKVLEDTMMHEILMAFVMLAPIVSKNPVEQDTVAITNIHLTVGYRPANDILSQGGEAGVKFEYLLFHPVIIRSSVDYNFSDLKSRRLPEGQNQAVDLSVEALIYRGAKRLTAYFGGGLVYSLNHFKLKKQLTDSLFANSAIHKTDIENKYGYRVIMGFRVREHYTLEFGYQESHPSFMFWGHSLSGNRFIIYKDGELSTLRFTLGYVFSP